MTKEVRVQYLTDEAGNKQAAVVPFKEWEAILHELEELRTRSFVIDVGFEDSPVLAEASERLRILLFRERLKTAFSEVDAIRQGKAPRTSLTEFLDEG